MNVLILSRNQIKKRSWGRELFKLDIQKQHKVKFWGKYYESSGIFYIPKILELVEKPDVISIRYDSPESGYEE